LPGGEEVKGTAPLHKSAAALSPTSIPEADEWRLTTMPPVRFRHGCDYVFPYLFYWETPLTFSIGECAVLKKYSLSSGGGLCVVVSTLRVDIRVVKITVLGILSHVLC